MVSHALGVFTEDQFAAAVDAARAAFAADCGYAAEMAKAAVAVAEREHTARLRTALAAGVNRATAACAAHRGQFTCTVTDACGTGDCRFASGVLSDLHVPAGPGRQARPARHVRPGEGFGTGPALAALAAAVPFTVGVIISSADCATAADSPAA